jgi:hypothetical protein
MSLSVALNDAWYVHEITIALKTQSCFAEQS